MALGTFYHFAATYGLLTIYWLPGDCQVYSWTNQSGDIYNQPCINQLNFTWTYTPASPNPALIEWTKQNAGGTFDPIVRVISGTFTPTANYTGRVIRIGNTAELGLMNPASADDGTYRVKVTDNGGVIITSEEAIVSTVTTAILGPAGITATCGEDGKTVTCAGVQSLGIPGAILTLSYGSSSVDNGGTQTEKSQEMTSLENVTCSISGPATECLATGVINSTSVECGLTTTTTTTTSTATVTENNTAITTITTTGTTTTPLPIPIYGIVIIVVVVFIILLVAIICCARKCKCQNEKNREGEMCDVPEPQGALYLNLTNQKTGSNNQDEGSCVSSKVNTNQMTVAVDPVEDNPHPGQRSEVGM